MKRILLLSALAASMFGCAKEDIVICEVDGGVTPPVTNPTKFTSIADFTTRYGAAPQLFSLSARTAQTVVTAKGNRFSFAANNFIRTDNQPLSNSPVRVRIREVMGKADMVLSAMPTVAQQGELLESAGEFQIQATQDSVPLRINDTTQVRFQTVLPPVLTSQQGMQLFVGNGVGGGAAGCFSWIPLPTAAFAPTGGGFSGSVQGSLMNAGLGWINCDRFVGLPTSPPLPITINAPTVDKTKTAVFVVFDELNAVLQLCADSNNKFTANQLPTGAKVKVLVIHVDNERVYYAKQSLVVGSATAVTLTPTETDVTAMVADIRTL
ncbi:hypothetical protein [Solirubrum puertoriconensis]|uniref:Uncharacterized protein n=1 Tax=Solirubrum puertoriconensis TaxID=1751427 RepID=A0A9X0HJU5_SOLP1|nr:hypothetical protein [Solirubrum puertoriconensis]KUG07264.1 hypothetical protein ASU33_12915 [Solirubrum puertoriconensis]